MTKRELARSMQDQFGKGLLRSREFAKFMGIGLETAEDMLDGLDFIHGAYGAKQYSVDDIAEMLMQKRG